MPTALTSVFLHNVKCGGMLGCGVLLRRDLYLADCMNWLDGVGWLGAWGRGGGWRKRLRRGDSALLPSMETSCLQEHGNCSEEWRN